MVIAALDYLDVGNIRDSMASPQDAGLFASVAAATSTRFDVFLSFSQVSYDGQISEMLSVPGILARVEGINEGDSDLASMSYGGQTGYAAIAAAQTALYDAVKADPATAGLGVIGPSYGRIGDLANALNTAASSDTGNTHEYSGTGNPPGASIGTFISEAALVSASHPDIATEAGYYTGPSLSGTIAAYQVSGVSEVVEAKYDLTVLFDDWKAGIPDTYLYELFDEVADPGNANSEDHYGLFHADGSPKLAAVAVHDLMTILTDNGPARTDTFGYQIAGAPGTGNSLLLEKSTGTFELAVWNDIRLSDPTTGIEIANPAVPVTIRFGQYVQSISEFDPLTGTSVVLTWSNVNAINIDLPDHPVVFEIKPYTASQLSLQSFVVPVTVASNQSSENLWTTLIANAIESNANGAAAGVTIAAIGTAGTAGSVRFDPTTQTVSYTAPTYSPLSPSDSFTYTLVDALGNTVNGTVGISETAPPNTLYDTVAGTRINAPDNGWTLVSLAAGQSLYGNADIGNTFIGAADTQMYGSSSATFIAGDGNHAIGAGNNAHITLGNGNNTIGLQGSGNVVVTGNGNNVLYKSTGSTSITMGNGNQAITVGGQGNSISVGVGSSTIVLGTDRALAGYDRVTVAGGGSNTIDAVGPGDVIVVQGGDGNQILTQGGAAAITIGAGNSTVTALGGGNAITVLSGSNDVMTSGNGDTISLGSGGTIVWADGNSDRITTGSGFASIDFIGQNDIIDASHGQAVLTEQGSHNIIMLAAAGGVPVQIEGDVIAAADTLDLRAALAATNWDGRRTTLPDYLLVRSGGNASVIAIDADGRGPGGAVDIAVLNNSAGLTYAGLLAQAVTPTVAVALDVQQATLVQSVAAGTTVNLWGSILANAAGTDLSGAAGMTIAAIGTAGTAGSIRFDPTTQTVSYTAPSYSPLAPTDSFTYTLADTLGNTVTGTVGISETAPPNTVYDTVVGMRINAPGNWSTLVSLAAGQSLYANDYVGVTLVGGADTQMYGSSCATFIAGDGNHAIGAGNNAHITLGNGDNTIGLQGSGNVVVTGNGNNVLYESTGSTSITMGNGNQNITVGGQGNSISVGVGNSTIVLGTDGLPAGNDRVTVAGGSNTIDAAGHDEFITVQGGDGSHVLTQAGTATITLAAGNTTVTALKDSNIITVLSGSNDVMTNGNGDTITLGSGGTIVWAEGNSDRITTGSGFASIDFIGENDTIDASHGQAVLTEQGSHNIIILAAAGGVPVQINGDVIAASDTLDLRAALAATNWDGRRSTLPDYLLVRSAGNASVIAIDADGRGSGGAVDIAVLNNSANLSYGGLLGQAATGLS